MESMPSRIRQIPAMVCFLNRENRPTLRLKKRANFGKLYSFDKHGLTLIILSKRHQHTFKNYMHIK